MIPIPRREFVHGLGFRMLGLGLSNLSALAGPRADAEGPAGFGRVKHCIFLFLYGGLRSLIRRERMTKRNVSTVFFATQVAVAMAILMAGSEDLRAQPLFTSQDLFISGHDNVNIYRIPSLIVSPKGTILAFCEARQGDDGDPTNLVLKRSLFEDPPSQPRNLNGYPRTFGYGVNWQSMQVVLAGKGEAIMQPCPVVDRTTGEILICCQEIRGGLANLLKNEWHGRCLILSSVDDGVTWSSPREITESVGHFAAGPGIGIQLKSGRLVIPGYSKDGARCIFSDDHGKTWRAGTPVKNKGCNESQVVELSDGSLLMNMRQGGRRRYVALSKDQGETWLKENNEESLPDPGCQASILRFPNRAAGARDLLLFANPPHPAPFEARTNLTVRLSDDDGQTWKASREVDPGPGAYSSLAVLADGSTIGLLYETGEKHPYEKIAFVRFNLEWLTTTPKSNTGN
ncbi:MAG: exo-alpha-sialidase [Planctomycetes bacterium]|nr:exo-alpha-sialidase [Planctomycetota bacterium]